MAELCSNNWIRNWFSDFTGNTRVVNQKALEFFREELQTRLSSNYNVILKERKLPMSLLNDHQKVWEVLFLWSYHLTTCSYVPAESPWTSLLCYRNSNVHSLLYDLGASCDTHTFYLCVCRITWQIEAKSCCFMLDSGFCLLILFSFSLFN